MSRPFITFIVFNTLTTTFFTCIYNYCMKTSHKVLQQDDKIEQLLHRIQELEKSVNIIQQSIEDIEETITQKNNRVIESNVALSSKLDDFINYSYDVYDE